MITLPERRAGYTLVELLAVLALAGVLAAVHLRGPPFDPFARVAEASREIEAGILSARAEALAAEGEYVVLVEPGSLGDVRGRILAAAMLEGTDTVGADLGWIELRRGVLWGLGSAETGLLGEEPDIALLPAAVRCDADSCDTGGERTVVYYLTHARQPAAAAAVTLNSWGDVSRFTYDPGARAWMAIS